MTSRDNDGRTHHALRDDSPPAPSAWATFLVEPSAGLLARARIGWERFLASASEVPDE